ncbi:MAG: hypothetical protein JSV74_01745 [Dehalococcoidia bacterium]|nr:MAG: hypothetical protein JSV74_01745 [Dehalococcoidia bacterium]
MPPVFKTVISASVWILFAKGVLIAVATLYTAGKAFFDGEMLPMVAVAACAAGSFAFILACIAAWIRKKVE